MQKQTVIFEENPKWIRILYLIILLARYVNTAEKYQGGGGSGGWEGELGKKPRGDGRRAKISLSIALKDSFGSTVVCSTLS